MEYNKSTSSIRIFDDETIALLAAEDSVSFQQTQTSVWKDLLAGGVAGTAGVAIGHPFDTIKVRLQQQQQRPSNPKIPMVQLEGNASTYRGLYRGIGAPLATAAVVNASVFCVYGATSRLWDNHYPISATTEHSNLTTATITKHAVCGLITGLTTSLMLCPIDYVKIRLQTMQLQPGIASTPRPYSNMNSNSSFHLAKEILSSHHGLRGLYRGLFATILRQTPSLAAYFPVYHILKELIGEFFSSSSISNNNNYITNNNNNKKDSLWWSSALAGGLAGCLSWTIVYPIDVIKSRIQSLPLDAPAKERSFLHIARSISRNEGFARLIFSRGLAVTLLRAFPVNGTIFFVYESVNQQLQQPLSDSGWGNEKGIIGMNGHPAAVETRLGIKQRRRITLRVDERVVDIRDAS
jgi:solute carrier family 25 carnitine/acylcarnitine transporter 20/29